MKKLLILLLLVPLMAHGQDLKNIRRGGVNDSRTAARVNDAIDQTNTNTDGLTDANLRIDSSKSVFNYEDSTGTIRYIDFNLEDGWSMQEGRVGWDDDDKTMEIGLDQGSILQIGQEVVIRATNKSGVLISDGSVVYVDSAQGNRPTIRLASDTSATAILTLGVATQDIADNAIGYVTMIGLVRGYDTRAFGPGDPLWLGTTPGSLVNTRPPAPREAVTLGVALNSTEDGLIAVRPTVVQRLAWASDVNARDNQENNHLLQWNSDSSFWESRDSLAVSAITYTDTYWDDMRVPLTETKISPVNTEPDFEDRGDGMFAYGFDSDSDSTWVLNFIAQTPHQRKDSTSIEAHIHWQPDGTNTGAVVWKLIYSVANIESSWSVTDTLRIIDTGDGIALKQQIIDFGEIAGSDTLRMSSIIIGSVGRMGDAPDDTYTGTAYGIEIDFHYQINAPGSKEEYVK